MWSWRHTYPSSRILLAYFLNRRSKALPSDFASRSQRYHPAFSVNETYYRSQLGFDPATRLVKAFRFFSIFSATLSLIPRRHPLSESGVQSLQILPSGEEKAMFQLRSSWAWKMRLQRIVSHKK